MDYIEHNTEFELVSNITLYLNTPVTSYTRNSVHWILDKKGGMVSLESSAVQFHDCNLDSKTYHAIVGLCSTHGLSHEDYFSE